MTSCVEPAESLETFLVELLPDREADLLHLLDCPACQGRARETLERRSPAAQAVEVKYDGMLRGLEERMPSLLARREEQTAVARRLRDRLLAAPMEKRRGLAGTAALRDLGLVDLLLVDSWQLHRPSRRCRRRGLCWPCSSPHSSTNRSWPAG